MSLNDGHRRDGGDKDQVAGSLTRTGEGGIRGIARVILLATGTHKVAKRKGDNQQERQ